MMLPDLDWKECIKDSPKFRSSLLDSEKEIDSFENHLEKLVKQSDAILETGKAFQLANNTFISNLHSLMIHFKDDTFLLEAIGQISQTLSLWNVNHTNMLELCNSYFSQNISNFIKNDVRRVKDMRKQFQRTSEDLETALSKNSHVPRSKMDECSEAATQLIVAKNNYTKSSLEHLFEINLLHIKKRTETLNCLFSYLNGHERFLQDNLQNFNKIKPYTSKLTSQLEVMQSSCATRLKSLKAELTKVLNIALGPPSGQTISLKKMEDINSDCIPLEGYLYKRTTNAFKSWVRRWFIVENNQLSYCSQQRQKDTSGNREGCIILEKDLRLCNVLPMVDAERRFCFQIISPMKTHLLQADNERECRMWMLAIQEAAKKAYNKPNSPIVNRSQSYVELSIPSVSPTRIYSNHSNKLSPNNNLKETTKAHRATSDMRSILTVPGNQKCCDCGHPDPRWASYNLGITLCIECSGIHRSFGVHKSKVRSVTLDAWEQDQVKIMQQLGNDVANEIFELDVSATNDNKWINKEGNTVQKATPNSNRAVREAWITAKYIDKHFVRKRCRKFNNTKSTDTLVENNEKTLFSLEETLDQIDLDEQLEESLNAKNLSNIDTMSLNLMSNVLKNNSLNKLQVKNVLNNLQTGNMLKKKSSKNVYLYSLSSNILPASNNSLNNLPASYSAINRLSSINKSFMNLPTTNSTMNNLPSSNNSFNNLPAADSAINNFPATNKAINDLPSYNNNLLSNLPATNNAINDLPINAMNGDLLKCGDYYSSKLSHKFKKSQSNIKNISSKDSGLGISSEDTLTMTPPSLLYDTFDPLSEDWSEWEADNPMEANLLLCKSAGLASLSGMLKALALGADPNCRNKGGVTPLILAISTGQLVPVEFLLLNGAKCDVLDSNDRSPLHHAASIGHTGQICLLLKRNANQHIKDKDGLDPLNIAINNADANVVTILRLSRLNEEMRNTDNQGDDMFFEVFKDFSELEVPGSRSRNVSFASRGSGGD